MPQQNGSSPQVVYAREPFPSDVTKTIFLAGPTPRRSEDLSWRHEMIEVLTEAGFDGHIFVPEPREGTWTEDYTHQVEWEDEGLNRADCIIFWVPRDTQGTRGPKFPGFTTNDEWGAWKTSGKVVWGAPPDAEKVRYQQYYAEKFGAPTATTLEETARAALELIGPGVRRQNGECQVPLFVWRRPEFQAWYLALRQAGNRLDNARVLWAFWSPAPSFTGKQGPPPRWMFCYSMHVDIHVAAEGRNKKNEVVLFRPDISSALLYHCGETSTEIVLVKEFRSPARNTSGYVYELPGGSSAKDIWPEQLAADEIREELGLNIAPDRFRFVAQRQIGATLSAHTSSLYAAEVTAEEMAVLKQQQADGTVHGIEGESERTYTEIRTREEIFQTQDLDWSMLGMIYQALFD